MSSAHELAREQRHLDLLHRQVDLRRAQADAELRGTLRQSSPTPQARVERGVTAQRLSTQIARYDAAEHGLCFGRLDLADGTRRYLGRIGLPAEDREGEPLLVDWRAPAARAFYTATAGAPQQVRLRRHLHTRGRRVVRLDDELLDGVSGAPGDVELTGEAALLTALQAGRTGRMRDIVATLQAEQDRIIRSSRTGVLVVQGGPGTGKTVVALHRAAYLLYTHPRLVERGVLVVGPNPVFLSYIGQVLPGLGETSVLLATVGELFPGVVATATEEPAAAAVKGRHTMADVLAQAVRDRQAPVTGPVDLDVAAVWVRLPASFLEQAAERARGSLLPHNLARPLFVQDVVAEAARQLAAARGQLERELEEELARQVDLAALDRSAAADLARLFGSDAAESEDEAAAEVTSAEEFWRRVLPQEPALRRLLDRLWPLLTPQRLLADLYADPSRLASAAPQLTATERRALRRPAGAPWTPADVPLLDEAAELLGHDDSARRAREERQRAEEVAYAQGVLDIAQLGAGDEELAAADVIDAERLADRHGEADLRTVAERAAADRSWVFGHVVVDEAQELSPMAWRLLVRRCPTRSFTVVGDVAQTSEAAGASSWNEALTPFFGDRWRLEQLTVNYRTPAEIVRASERVLAEIHPDLAAPRPVREGAPAPWRAEAPAAELPGRAATAAREELSAVPDGRVAVIAAPEVLPALAAELPEASWGDAPDLERRLVLLTARQAKGLEFDSVVLLPHGIDALGDLYVALTRSTQRLCLLHPAPVPHLLADIPLRVLDAQR
ncbi:HelD family protein [Streptacidiphilus monticola]|uniref:HelD family protein n=1 Tax=Streptacidiphilus monticola TaxID=2161674 RepID=A0ABW1FXC3_9ACTN